MKVNIQVKTGVFAATLALALSLPAFAGDGGSNGEDNGQEIKLSDCPAAVQKALQEIAAGGQIATVEKSDEVVYEAEVTKADGQKVDVQVDPEGKPVMDEADDEDGGCDGDCEGEDNGQGIKLSDCPAAVQKALQENALGGQITHVEKADEDGDVVYDADVTTADGQKLEVEADPDGKLISIEADDEDGNCDGNCQGEDDGQEIKLSDCPAAVQKAFQENAAGGQITQVEKSEEVSYEAEVTRADGQKLDVEVDSEGKIIVVEADDEDGDIVLLPREYALLEYLARRHGHIVTRTEIEEHIYGGDTEPASNAVDSAVCSLRQKLARHNPEPLIRTHRQKSPRNFEEQGKRTPQRAHAARGQCKGWKRRCERCSCNSQIDAGAGRRGSSAPSGEN
jgi:uncharacterized membrane protein YkoI